MRTTIGLAALLALAACTLPGQDPNAEALAKTAFDQLRAGDYPSLLAEVSKPDFGPNPQPVLEKMHQLLPAGEPKPGQLVGWNSFAGTGGVTMTLNYQYDYPDARVTSSVMLAKDAKQPKGWIIRGFHINLNSAPAPTEQPKTVPAPAKPTAKPQVT